MMSDDESLVQGSCSNSLTEFDQKSKASQEDQNVKQELMVLEWPSLEKVMRFYAGDMDSSRVFIFVTPESSSGIGDSGLYLWVGKGFLHDKEYKDSERCAELADFSVKEVINNLVSKMGLSKDTHVKVVKQDEEPSEFVALLSSL